VHDRLPVRTDSVGNTPWYYSAVNPQLVLSTLNSWKTPGWYAVWVGGNKSHELAKSQLSHPVEGIVATGMPEARSARDVQEAP
jgi:hypothetical protein